jgi:hypothetical protein
MPYTSVEENEDVDEERRLLKLRRLTGRNDGKRRRTMSTLNGRGVRHGVSKGVEDGHRLAPCRFNGESKPISFRSDDNSDTQPLKIG